MELVLRNVIYVICVKSIKHVHIMLLPAMVSNGTHAPSGAVIKKVCLVSTYHFTIGYTAAYAQSFAHDACAIIRLPNMWCSRLDQTGKVRHMLLLLHIGGAQIV